MRKIIYGAGVVSAAFIALVACIEGSAPVQTAEAAPVATVSRTAPPALTVCRAMHERLLNGHNAANAADLERECLAVINEVDGACRTYAKAASRLGFKAQRIRGDSPIALEGYRLAREDSAAAWERCAA